MTRFVDDYTRHTAVASSKDGKTWTVSILTNGKQLVKGYRGIERSSQAEAEARAMELFKTEQGSAPAKSE